MTVNINLDSAEELEAAYLLFAWHTVSTELFATFLEHFPSVALGLKLFLML